METLIVRPKNKQQVTAIKAFMNALKIAFEEEKPDAYDPDFVAMIEQGDKDLKEGKGIKIDIDDLWK